MSESIEANSSQSNQEGPDFYEVEEILNKKETIAGTLYLIKWKDYPNPKDYTWQPLDHLKSVMHLVRQFDQKRDSLKKKIKKQYQERVFKGAKNIVQSIQINSSVQNRCEQGIEEVESREEAEKKGKLRKEKEKYLPKVIQIHAKKKSRQDKKYWNNPLKQSAREKEKDETSKYLLPLAAEKNKADSSPIVAEQERNYWFKSAPYRLGGIMRHAIEDGKLFYWFNVVTQEGELVSVVRLSEEQAKNICKQQQANYILEIIARCQQQMATSSQHQLFQQSWKQSN